MSFRPIIGSATAAAKMASRIVRYLGFIAANRRKHFLHCLIFIITIYVFIIISVSSQIDLHDWCNNAYGIFGCTVLYAIRMMPFLALPQCIFNFLGLVCYNAFPGDVSLKGSLHLSPSICFRVVTRGSYPDLVRHNLQRNLEICLNTGLVNYIFEVVSDKPICLLKNRFVREIVVPSSYSTPNGSLFKARALQYCLEDDVSILNDDDWVVHLDEETLLTENAVKGIFNFTIDGRHQFGQGLVTYTNENVVNWLTTAADNVRVADDMGKLRFQFNVFHKPLFSWKGSFMVCQVGAERQISFDHGPKSSITEDIHFSMVAFSQGYSFDFVEGEMWEKSPFTLCDYLRQRKRWVNGGLMVAHCSAIPWRYRILWALTIYAKLTMPFALASIPVMLIFPTGPFVHLDVLTGFVAGVCSYMFLFGAVKSMSFSRLGIIKWLFRVIASLLVIPISIVLEAVSSVWCYFGHGNEFYIVDKNIPSQTSYLTV